MMSLTSNNQDAVLHALDTELSASGEKRELYVCGGGALLVVEIVDRPTRDLDVLTPVIDPILRSAASRVAAQFGLQEDWLNNGPASLASELPKGWEKRATTVFQGKSLTLKGLDRMEILLTKIYAFCDREDDWVDLKKLKPTLREIDQCNAWVLERDGSVYWPKRVEECFVRMKAQAIKRWVES